MGGTRERRSVRPAPARSHLRRSPRSLDGHASLQDYELARDMHTAIACHEAPASPLHAITGHPIVVKQSNVGHALKPHSPERHSVAIAHEGGGVYRAAHWKLEASARSPEPLYLGTSG